MTKKQRGYTIVIIPEEGSGNITRVQLPSKRLKRVIKALATVTIVLLCSLGYTIYHLAKTPQRWHVEAQVAAQEIRLTELSQKIESSQATLDRIQQLDRKLRTILGTSFEFDSQSMLGVGGPDQQTQYNYDEILDPERRMELAKLDLDAEELDYATKKQEVGLYDLQASMAEHASRLASTPSIYPTKGWITSLFGSRNSPFTGDRKMHEGIDIATRWGNPVASAADGVVLYAGVKSGYGKVIFVDHGYGLSTRYGHLSRLDVVAGQTVRRGDVIGAVGNTGRSTGPHLHYEVRVDGIPVDPQEYLLVDSHS